ncbi:PAN domain-containing protein At5g03700 isoform X3 [Olea europaea var. sylvestris]|nr:PAN domain-containing protein At5g03700 isoform X3 [Olea europaea var. sylvestris]XP_022890846.1 PAN domain-containing protein At5g03700 isoform X3 [Olea europaea var. sylvestris]XP_022890847.1 PAN domain-containing protein At5g03700 isoform X3 [Olea europaea var. sylvestris]
METEQLSPNFRTALSVEAINEKYWCSLDIFLGDVRVWTSGHLSKFYTTEKCVLELTYYGDLRLKDQNERIGWRSGTSGQGVERLQLLRTGNLVLVDSLNLIKWQSFNFPTNIMMWGQSLSSATRLTSFPINSSNLFYSFEIQYDKIALYLNFGNWKYSYWEFRPSIKKNITFVQLSSEGLGLFTGKHQKIDQITSEGPEPLRFLALGNNTGNLGLYHYSAEQGEFEESYEALNTSCDLPLACKPYGICTSSNMCSCIRVVESDGFQPDCRARNIEGLCGRSRAEMLELRGAITVLKGNPNEANVTKEICANLCLDDCSCVAAQYTNLGECFLYKFIRGIKQVERRNGLIFMVKIPKGEDEGHGRHSGLQKWVIIVVGVVDGFIIFLVLGGVGYYIIRKKLKNSPITGQET